MTLPTLVLFPLMLVTMLFLVQAAVWQHYRQLAATAAQKAAAGAAAVGPQSGPVTPEQAAHGQVGEARAAANAELARLGVGGVRTVNVNAVNDTVVVTVTVDVPTLFGVTLHASASAGRPVEVFRPAPPGLGGTP